jgi:IS605 OrfB family transposase
LAIAQVEIFGSKEQRYMKDINHKISSEIVSIAEKHKAVIQMENLTDIRGRVGGYLAASAPRRSVRAQFTHTAPHIQIHEFQP